MKENDLILVTDMQCVYLKGEKWACRDTEGAAANILKIISLKEKNFPSAAIIFTRFIASENPRGAWISYNEAYADVNDNPGLNEIVPSLKEVSEKYPLYDKQVYSSLSVPEIREKALKADRVVLTGVVSECCVLSTAFSLIDLGQPIIWLTDGVSGLDKEKEDGATLMLKGLSPVHTSIMTVAEYLSES